MLVAGADIWKGRWAVVVLAERRFERAFVAPTIESALAQLREAVTIGVDIPIGLPALGERRQSDQLARDYIGPRRSSVFMTPPMEMVRARTHAEANGLAANGAGRVSVQAFGLRKAILEVQAVALDDGRFYEVHPEVSFVRANGDATLAWPKTSWNGVQERRRILAAQGIRLPEDLGPAGAAGVADLLDAAIVAWSAHRIATGQGQSLPSGSRRVGGIWR